MNMEEQKNRKPVLRDGEIVGYMASFFEIDEYSDSKAGRQFKKDIESGVVFNTSFGVENINVFEKK